MQPGQRGFVRLPLRAAERKTAKPATGLALAGAICAREIARRVVGLLHFLACIALGVAAMGGVNSVCQAITIGRCSRRARSLLGGDIRIPAVHREAE